MLPALILMLASAPAPAPAPAPDKIVGAELTCAAGRFRLRSRTVAAGPEAPVSPVSQAMTVEVAGRLRTLPVLTQGRVRLGGRRVQRAFISSWACVEAASASYVELGYACAANPGEHGACPGGDEWAPLLDDHGRVLDTGLPNGGPPSPALRARERLEKRLGLSKIFENGVTERSVLGFP